MAEANTHKIKSLKLWELLSQETDENTPMKASDVCKRLLEQGISCDRRTLTHDINVLNQFGFEVMSTLSGHEKAYYVVERGFSVPELKIMIDAVQAAGFITEKKTAELIRKIAELGGSNCAEILKSNMVCFNTRKHTNERIYYNVNEIEKSGKNHWTFERFYRLDI